MNIAVILQQVPDTEAVVKPDPSNPGSIIEQDIKFVLNPYDEYAVEEALQIAGKDSGEVIGVIIGPETSETIIRTALAMGVQRAVLISDPQAVAADIVTKGQILAAVLKDLDVSLILCGKEVIDTQDDAIAAVIAHSLNMPHVLNAGKIELNDDKVNVHRDIEGQTLVIEAALPAVISCQKGLNNPRYPTLIAIKKARKKEIKHSSFADIGFEFKANKTKVVSLTAPPARAAGIVVEGEPDEMVAKCIDWLSNESKII